MILHYTLWLLTVALLSGTPRIVLARAVAAGKPQETLPTNAFHTRHLLVNAIRAAQDEGSEHRAAVDLEKSFDDSVLFQLTHSGNLKRDGSSTESSIGIAVTCNTCYIKGLANVALNIEESFNTSQILSQVEASVDNTLDSIRTYVQNVSSEIADGFLELDFGFDDIPPPDIDFNVDIDNFPDVQLQLELDELEVFMDMTTTLSSGVTYTLNLYSSLTPLGGAIPGVGTIGLVFSIDLIISVENEIQIDNGFHIKLDDGVLISIALFSKRVSQLAFNGGQFEILPVKIESSTGSFTSILQLGLHAGVGAGFNPGIDTLEASMGVETKIFANIAEFITNVTASSDEVEDKENSCGLRAQHVYQFGLGAAAGATVALNGHIWGPSPETTVPIYYTTLADVCIDGAPSSAPTSMLQARQNSDDEGSEQPSLVTVTRTATQCASSGLLNCPASLQLAKEYVATETPKPSIVRTVGFGESAGSVLASSGSPRSYVPPPPPAEPTGSSDAEDEQDEDDSLERGSSKKPDLGLIIGLSVGLGVPALLAVLAALWWCSKRRKVTDGTVLTTVWSESQLPSTTEAQKTSQKQHTQVTTTSAEK